MSTFKIIYLFLLIGLLTACGEEETTTTDTPTTTSTTTAPPAAQNNSAIQPAGQTGKFLQVMATVDGQAYTASGRANAVPSPTGGGQLIIAAGQQEGHLLRITFETYRQTGKQIGDIPGYGSPFLYRDTENLTAKYETKGEIELTQHDETAQTVSGVFSFVATNKQDASDVVTITNGKFQGSY